MFFMAPESPEDKKERFVILVRNVELLGFVEMLNAIHNISQVELHARWSQYWRGLRHTNALLTLEAVDVEMRLEKHRG
ncbi:hypothetical protein MJT46_019043 [Ovis ammon polii x Ovis aries]|nr:hypothetical protein MJT46_019043 [Ovis ammon polii x Ovis aries]